MLRIAGPLVFAVGLIFTIAGVGSFFLSFGSFEPPRYFWCAFVGLPLMFVGGVMMQFGFLGAVARYVASEGAPVVTDTANYVTEETREGVRTVAGAIGEGLRDGMGQQEHKHCARCGVFNDADARFCKSCGTAV